MYHIAWIFFLTTRRASRTPAQYENCPETEKDAQSMTNEKSNGNTCTILVLLVLAKYTVVF